MKTELRQERAVDIELDHAMHGLSDDALIEQLAELLGPDGLRLRFTKD